MPHCVFLNKKAAYTHSCDGYTHKHERLCEIRRYMHPAIAELTKIIELETTPTAQGFERRQKALTTWINRWVQEYYENQSVTDVKYLSVDFQDFLSLKISQDILLTVVEECIKIKKEQRKIEAELTLLRKKPRT